MKKLLFAILGLVCLAACKSNSNEFKLTFTPNPEEKMTMLYIQRTDSTDYSKYDAITDSVALVDGKFVYTAELNEPSFAYILSSIDGMPNFYMPVLMVPGEECVLTYEDEHYVYSGSSFYKEMGETDAALRPLNKEMNEFVKMANDRIEAAGDSAQAVQMALMEEWEKKSNDMDSVKLAYLKENSKKAGVVAYMIQNIDLEKVLENTDASVKNGVLKPFLDYYEDMINKQKEHEEKLKLAQENIQPGKPAPDFTLTDINGNGLSLSSLRGKYVVLDFWGSWCGWCIKGIPEMKEAYAKYAGKMEILGIDCNDSDEAWRKAVEEYEIPWLHVYNPKDSGLTETYAIEGYPTKIVVDPEGNIAKVVVGEDPAFYEYLDEIM